MIQTYSSERRLRSVFHGSYTFTPLPKGEKGEICGDRHLSNSLQAILKDVKPLIEGSKATYVRA